MRKGGRGGFLLIFYLDDSQTMHPIVIYAKSHQSVRDRTRIESALKQLGGNLGTQEGPASRDFDPA